jgi:hypothetical protein
MEPPEEVAAIAAGSDFRRADEQRDPPGPTALHPGITERLRRPLAQGRGLARGVAGRVGRGARARLYKLPCSISSSAPAMTLGRIASSANGSIRPLRAIPGTPAYGLVGGKADIRTQLLHMLSGCSSCGDIAARI